jgi:hypothetical protein
MLRLRRHYGDGIRVDCATASDHVSGQDRAIVRERAKTLDLNRTYCYSLFLDKPQKERPDKDAEVKQAIIRICIQFPTYGYRRVTAVLRNRLRRAVNRKKVQRIMQEEGLTVPVKERIAKRTRESGRIPVTRSNEHFQVDMTKVWCGVRGAGGIYLRSLTPLTGRSSAGPFPCVAPPTSYWRLWIWR